MYEYLRQRISKLECDVRELMNSSSSTTTALVVQDEGVSLNPVAQTINFTGTGVTVTNNGSSVATVDIPGGGGSVQADLDTIRGSNFVTITNSAGDDANLQEANINGEAGVMSSPDKVKLNGIETNATADQTGLEIVGLIDNELGSTAWQQGGNSGGSVNDLGVATSATQVEITNTAGSNASILAATNTTAGVMSASDKQAVGANTSSRHDAASADDNSLNFTGQAFSVNLSEDANNALELRVNGLYASGGSGGGASTFNVTIGTCEFKGEYVGSAPTITEQATNGIYDIVVPVNSSILWIDFKGNANDVNASGNITFNYDNSANATERRFDVTPFALIGGNANKPLNKYGSTDYVETQTVTANVTAIVIPNLGGTGTSQNHTFALTIK